MLRALLQGNNDKEKQGRRIFILKNVLFSKNIEQPCICIMVIQKYTYIKFT